MLFRLIASRRANRAEPGRFQRASTCSFAAWRSSSARRTTTCFRQLHRSRASPSPFGAIILYSLLHPDRRRRQMPLHRARSRNQSTLIPRRRPRRSHASPGRREGRPGGSRAIRRSCGDRPARSCRTATYEGEAERSTSPLLAAAAQTIRDEVDRRRYMVASPRVAGDRRKRRADAPAAPAGRTRATAYIPRPRAAEDRCATRRRRRRPLTIFSADCQP